MSAEVDVRSALDRLGLQSIGPVEALTGGVSCEVFRVELSTGPVCVKRALAQLRVTADWSAPVERSHSEVRWLQAVESIADVISPHVIAEDRAANLFVMTWFEPQAHPVWKSELAAGRVNPSIAAQVGSALGAVHAATARDPDLSAEFQTGDLFQALRLEPYLLHTAARHPDLAEALTRLADETLAHNTALVHGDVSPKNILVGPNGPVLLDAECAWWGDPAFDLAFCLNHLLLKCMWRPQHAAAYLTAFEALRDAYMRRVDWEPGSELDRRAANLLAALLLARVDGKSPVEYLVAEADKAFVRDTARTYLKDPPDKVADIARDWAQRIELR